MKTAGTRRASLLVVALASVRFAASAGSQSTFASPDEAADALLVALETDDYPLFLSVAGQQVAGFWSTGDLEKDTLDRGRFVDEARRKGIRKDAWKGERRMLYVGQIEQPFPAPLVRTDAGWRFDDDAGLRE